MKIKVLFPYETETCVRVKLEVVRFDGIRVYGETFDNDGIGFAVKNDNQIEFEIENMNLLQGKFSMMLYLIDSLGNTVGSIKPFAEFDVLDSKDRQGMAYMNCRCIVRI